LLAHLRAPRLPDHGRSGVSATASVMRAAVQIGNRRVRARRPRRQLRDGVRCVLVIDDRRDT
jgi:hypothetical protein